MMPDTKKVDVDILNQIIQLAEEAMVRPFSKKKPEMEEGMESEDPQMEMSEGSESEGSEFGDDDLETLMEEYKRSKGR